MKILSIVIPIYNEEKIVGETIKKLKEELTNLHLDYELIAVNDASTDKTKEILERVEGIKLINHNQNKGYGAAIKTGIKQSQGEFILITDADGTYPIEAIPELVKFIPEYDMVVGARKGKGVKIPLIRKPAKWILNKLANYLSGTKIPDLNSGLRIIKKSLIEKYLYILPDGFSFTSTITLAGLTNSYRIKYIPIAYSKRTGKSKFRPIRDTLNFFQLMIRTVLYFNPLKVFIPFSIILFFLGVVVFLWSYFFAPKVLDTTTAVLIISSVQMLAIGMIADLIVKSRK